MEMAQALLGKFVVLVCVFAAAAGAAASPPAACAADLAGAANLIPFRTSSLRCSSAWTRQDFAILYEEERRGLWSFVLSAPAADAYVAVGFSPDGKMVGASAMAGWISSDGKGIAKQYALRGTDSTDCPPDQGTLQLIPGSSLILRRSSRLFLAFQLNTTQPLNKLIYALGPEGKLPSSDFYLAEHAERTSTTVDYASGLISAGYESSYLRRVHGLLTLIGWGGLMPIGIVVARHCKSWDPVWFYAHIFIQGGGFILGLAGLITGFKLEDEISNDVDTHKAIGIFILVAGSLQVMALLARPGKKAKLRKHWNLYHHNLGRIAVAFAVGNIFYGLSLADEESSWKIGYGVFLGLWFVISLVLEVRSCGRKDEFSSL